MARFKEYKLVTDYNEWRKSNPNTDVYAITNYGEDFLFDVAEEDFIKMADKGIVNSEGSYFLLGRPTEEEIAELAKEYGILWTDLEEDDTINTHKKVYVVITKVTKVPNIKAFDTLEKAKFALSEWKVSILIEMLNDTTTKWNVTTHEDDYFNAYATDSTEDNVYGKIEEVIIQ